MRGNSDGAPGPAKFFEGYAEVGAAVEVIAGYLTRSGISDAAVSTFSVTLNGLLASRFTNHWWPEQPSRGEGFRHILCGKDRVDSILITALNDAGISIDKFAEALPRDLSLWCDPGVVTTRVGTSGELRTVRVGSALTPPHSPGRASLSVKAKEFRPSPPSSPPMSRTMYGDGLLSAPAGHSRSGWTEQYNSTLPVAAPFHEGAPSFYQENHTSNMIFQQQSIPASSGW